MFGAGLAGEGGEGLFGGLIFAVHALLVGFRHLAFGTQRIVFFAQRIHGAVTGYHALRVGVQAVVFGTSAHGAWLP